ncbi:MAG TPA: HlyD family efflux transporter periplasmic adaptor subunit [Xanthobacteraceae bacterium]|nr:HlyD family efflux transporter periplasmic adaptor subunit [Xanthobacteraceae bacterium]
MDKNWKKRAAWILILGAVVLGLGWFAWPRPVGVDLGVVSKGPMEVTIDDEAKTRVRHVYTVSAPVAGKVLRISQPSGEQGVSVHVGDQVKATETVVAVMQPTAPSFLDVRSREELQAMLAAASASVALAEAEVGRIEAALEFSRGELRRAEALARTNTIAERTLQRAQLDVKTNEAALASAKAQLDVRHNERASIAARLIDPSSATPGMNTNCCIRLSAPTTGVVLKIIQDSEAVVPAGAPLIEIGDPRDLEIVADLLSTDAVQIKHGAPVRIDGWGGPPIKGRLTRVDPAGFVKTSALGIEEQRVRTTIDLVDSPDNWSKLGHDYRVIVHVTVWSEENVLTVPISALFRRGDSWAVFVIREGRARAAAVEIGKRNNRVAEVISGVGEGERVVLHPSDRIKNGVAVEERDGQ